jgi:transglutaminase-like putative cysteine protease
VVVLEQRTAVTSVRIELQIDLGYEIAAPGADFIFNIQAAHTASQNVAAEDLTLSLPVEPRTHPEPTTGNRILRLRTGAGQLQLSYRATVDVAHHRADPAALAEVPMHRLPAAVMGYVYPSRYCQSDRLLKFANSEFGHLRPGHARVDHIRRWVNEHVTFRSNTSDASTSAVDTLVERVGVCRDFAHLMIALCRALNIPARFATGTDYGADPALGPPDFHAYVEVYLGQRWYIFDPSGTAVPMGLLRIGTGRDAADVAVATIFGAVKPAPPAIRAVAVAGGPFVPPTHCTQALSTDAVDG